MFFVDWLDTFQRQFRPVFPSSRPLQRHRRRSRRISISAVELLERRTLLTAGAFGDLYFSLSQNATDTSLSDVGNVEASDIIKYDGSTFSLFFDGSDLGLSAADVDAFAIISETEILISFSSDTSLTGLGTVSSADVVLFTATSLGETTSGSFTMYFDGSDVGLSSSRVDNIDAIELLDNGDLVFSTEGDISLANAGSTFTAQDEDLTQFTATSLGETTAGTFSTYMDATDAGFEGGTEDVNGAAVDSDGSVYLTTLGSFFASGVFGDNEDIVQFNPSSLGDDTAGSLVSPLYFNGNIVDASLLLENIDGLDLFLASPDSVNVEPTADAQSVGTGEDTSIVIQLTGDDGNTDADQSLTFTIVDGPMHGSIIGFDPNTGLLTYVPDADYNGADSFTFTTTDDDTAGGPALTSAAATIDVGIDAVNDAPVITAPTELQSGNEDVAFVINGISISDVDVNEGDGMMQVTLSVNSGSLTVDAASMATGTIDGNGTSTVVLNGTLGEINATLAGGVTYLGNLNFSGADTLYITADDLGNTGSGGAQSSMAGIPIVILSVNQQLDNLKSTINDLVASGDLNKGIGKALNAKLKTKGNPKAVVGRTQAFINQLEGLTRAGKIDPEVSAQLIEGAETVIQSAETGLSKGGSDHHKKDKHKKDHKKDRDKKEHHEKDHQDNNDIDDDDEEEDDNDKKKNKRRDGDRHAENRRDRFRHKKNRHDKNDHSSSSTSRVFADHGRLFELLLMGTRHGRRHW